MVSTAHAAPAMVSGAPHGRVHPGPPSPITSGIPIESDMLASSLCLSYALSGTSRMLLLRSRLSPEVL